MQCNYCLYCICICIIRGGSPHCTDLPFCIPFAAFFLLLFFPPFCLLLGSKLVPKRPPNGAILRLVFCFFSTVHFGTFATHVFWPLRLCVSPKMLFFLRFFYYFHLHASCCFFLFGRLLPPQFASILGVPSAPNRAPNWCKKILQIWLVFGSHFGSILGPKIGPETVLNSPRPFCLSREPSWASGGSILAPPGVPSGLSGAHPGLLESLWMHPEN